MTAIIKALNLKIAATGMDLWNNLRYALRIPVNRAENRRIIRLKQIARELTSEGVGQFSETQVREILRKKAMQ